MDFAWVYGACVFVFGLLFGSFLNVCIYRLPRGLSVVSPRSACPKCGTPIAAYDNIPVLSWIILGGRCRQCKARISFRYAAVELLCGALFLLCYAYGGLSLLTLKGCVFSFLFLGLVFTDADLHILPDKMTLTGFWLALAFSLVVPVPGPFETFFPDLTDTALGAAFCSLLNSLMGAAIGAGVLFVLGWVYLKLRNVEGMGFGDVKLMAMTGAALGPALTLFVLCTASLLGGGFGVFVLVTVFAKRMGRYRSTMKTGAAGRAYQAAQVALRGFEIPFGVFLCTMALVAWFYGQRLVNGYLALYSSAR